MKIVVTGGGTAGHIFPALATIEELKKRKPGVSFLYIGTRNQKERNMVEAEGIKFKSVFTGKFRRYWRDNFISAWQNFIDIFRLFFGFFQSLWIINKFKPNVIFSKGGYVGLPTVVAGWCLGVPCLVHESDAQLGLANKLSLRFCKKIAISFPPDIFPQLQASKVLFTGNPVRSEIKQIDQNETQRFFKITPGLPVLLVTGGSQGAHKINEAIVKSLFSLLSKTQIIHLSGDKDYSWLCKIKSQLPSDIRDRYILYNFLTDRMKDALSIADLVISRAGANILAEISLLGKPVMLVPLEGHQYKNAQFFNSKKAAVVLENQKFNCKILTKTVLDLLNNPQQLNKLSASIKNLAEPEAVSALAEEILKIAIAPKKTGQAKTQNNS